ncbi:hypothetical protein Trydic_g5488 [Trypoxylus dichotomus]
MLIGETHLRVNCLSLPNYRVYPTDREDARGGGTAIVIKSSINHHADLALDLNIEAITVNIATGPVKLVTAYKAPNRLLLEDELSEIFDTREQSFSPTISTPSILLLQLGQAAREDEEPLSRRTVLWAAFTNHLSINIGPIAARDGPIQLEAAVRQVTERVSDSLIYATNSSRAVDARAFILREVRDLIWEKNRLQR